MDRLEYVLVQFRKYAPEAVEGNPPLSSLSLTLLLPFSAFECKSLAQCKPQVDCLIFPLGFPLLDASNPYLISQTVRCTHRATASLPL